MELIEELRQKLFDVQDVDYKKFQEKILKTVDPEKIIGVRTPALCKLTQEFFRDRDKEKFLNSLPHAYFEENSIHTLLICDVKDYSKCLQEVKKFLPFIDNWATCDSLIPKIFAKHTEELEGEIKSWLESGKIYTVRFGILMLMKFYLGKNFDEKYLKMVTKVALQNYYVEMMSAWFFSESLIKHYDAAIKFLEKSLLSESVHRKTIQKAVESRRITKDKKIYLKSLRN